ncbi:hypothetical protein P0W64_09205 [Tsukamurella sp. 8F]|uniref:hypothetical protein n=1 Tax=unclassified Tsukamurella TaxID=2633480 RepID=UPI0023BA1F6C|nr:MULTISPECIES: hypothetical protein [unclassified Tsukamurella]MDF0531911.1 hypothetical protein [Tsukamurella sp. 8J]MDF0586949.1 hypothetical protein [Tsukamurella sp. 8F]
MTALGTAAVIAAAAASPAYAAPHPVPAPHRGSAHPHKAAPKPAPKAAVHAGPSSAVVEAAIKRGKSMLGTDSFGDYGCEDFVDAAYGRTTANGIPHDGAISYYQNLAAQGHGHPSLPAPRGALVFSQGEDGGHVDISLGNGKYLSGGVQGFGPGWGDGSNIQILPSANLGTFTVVGWAYAPWT